ncbi:ATP-dependent zinc protease [Methylophaga thiooxydans]|uniref:retropepsin-like aspartic peptidase RloA3 n=1 Tax=Methylophaga thiooxydans TaxID=392484 RepID=UPI0023540447|nr:ATP-dependent zinc protease [Methylophaga thiooxydans]
MLQRCCRRSTVLVLLLCFGFSHTALAEQSFGWIEKIKIQPWNVQAKAKLDSGALTSSMHAADVELSQREGKKWVTFTVQLQDTDTGEYIEKRIERPLLREFTVKGAGGRDKRPVVLMNVCIGNTIYEEQFSLRNRDNMLYPILLGRRTIQHLGPIDVTRTFTTESNCDADAQVLGYQDVANDENIGLN